MMKQALISAFCAAGIFGATTALAAPPAPPEVFETKYCSGCHAIDKKMVGPAMAEIAKKYTTKTDAADYLKGKIKSGGSGVWGAVPMPPNATISDADLKSLTDWIMKL